MNLARERLATGDRAAAAAALASAVESSQGDLERLRAVFTLGTGVHPSERLPLSALERLAFHADDVTSDLHVAMDGGGGLICDVAPAGGEPISIAMQQADVGDILGMLSAASKMEIRRADCALGGPVSLALTNVSASELLRRVLFSQGLSCTSDGGARVLVTCTPGPP
jgi:hypothetical protein